MIALPHLAEIEQHMLQLSGVADALEARSVRAAERVHDWIAEAERILRARGIPQAGDLAVIRTELAAARRPTPRGGATTGAPTPSRRTQREEVASEALARAARILDGVVAPSRQLLQEGERVARQIAAVAKAKAHPDPVTDDWGAVAAAWEQAAQDGDLMSAAVHLVGLVGRVNAMLLYARARTQV